MKLTINADKITSLAFCLFLAYAMMLVPTDALAQFTGPVSGGGISPSSDSGTLGNLLCSVAGWFTGTVGQGIATLAIIVIGIGALMGKVSWGMAIIVGLGVAVIFGADTIVGELSGTQGCR